MRFALLFFTLLFACDSREAVQVDPAGSVGSDTGAESDATCGCADEASCVPFLQSIGEYPPPGEHWVKSGESPSCADPSLPPPYPKGFPEKDRYAGKTSQACADITDQEANGNWQRAIESWCLHRVHHSSRGEMGNIVESRVDGSQVHDRDRPSAYWFYEAAIRTDRLDPESCVHHRIDKLEGHPSACYIMAKEWPFKVPAEIGPETTKRWLGHPHDMERYGARGPIDFNALVGYGAIPGCYPPEAFDRVDVSITAVVRRSIRICAKYGCRTKWEIKEHWNDPVD